MDNRAIGVFDSGLGGLTTVRELMRVLPTENIIYFGDTGRVPYGGRSKDTILRYARQDARFLLEHDIKAIVIACNTADATARSDLERLLPVPVFGVAQPAAALAAQKTQNGKIGVIGTKTTISSGVYESLLQSSGESFQIMSAACPLLVPLVENGRFRPGDTVAETVVAEYLQPLLEWGCDTLILGCTHYPLLIEIIRNYMGPTVALINSGAAAAQLVRDNLLEKDILSNHTEQGSCRFYVSDAPEAFTENASLFLQKEIRDTVTQVDINKY